MKIVQTISELFRVNVIKMMNMIKNTLKMHNQDIALFSVHYIGRCPMLVYAGLSAHFNHVYPENLMKITVPTKIFNSQFYICY